MAENMAADESKTLSKMKQLPRSAKVTKRPLLHPQIASPYAGHEKQKVIYLGSRTPFMSAFKRVKYLLKQVDKRSMESELQLAKQKNRRTHSKPRAADDQGPLAEEVVVKATGKAIDKALGLALMLQKQADLKVTIRTGSTSAVDDIEPGESVQDPDAMKDEDEEELPEARIRGVSVLEIAVRLR